MNNDIAKVTVFGAAEVVTGSKYLYEADNKKILIDCGMFQGKKELRLLNWERPPFDPRDISAIVLTHAHIDHTGYLPVMVKNGFRGPIYCTPATKDLLQLLLIDAAHLQEEEARFANKWKTTKHDPAKPLFNDSDARAALKLVKTFDFYKPLKLSSKITAFASMAGHILGSASLTLEYNNRRAMFSGDVGRYDAPILVDPEPVELGDLIFCESTYGNREHTQANIMDDIAKVINSALKKEGPIIIPSFAVGRTQVLLYYLYLLESVVL